MRKPELFSPFPGMETIDALRNLHEAGKNRKRLVNVLVAEARRISELVEVRYPDTIRFDLEDLTHNLYREDDGWVLHILQRYEPEWDDPHLSRVAKILISDLEINGGIPRVKFEQWIDSHNQIVNAEYSFDVPPNELVLYINSIAATGNARPSLS